MRNRSAAALRQGKTSVYVCVYACMHVGSMLTIVIHSTIFCSLSVFISFPLQSGSISELRKESLILVIVFFVMKKASNNLAASSFSYNKG